MPLRINTGDVVQMKKPHPCGGDIWEVLRSGADFKLRCGKCGRLIDLPRPKLEKGVKRLIDKNTIPLSSAGDIPL